jgi:hypothetical protein
MWTAFIWLRIRTNCRLVWTWQWTFGFHKRRGICWPAERLSVCEKFVLGDVRFTLTWYLHGLSACWIVLSVNNSVRLHIDQALCWFAFMFPVLHVVQKFDLRLWIFCSLVWTLSKCNQWSLKHVYFLLLQPVRAATWTKLFFIARGRSYDNTRLIPDPSLCTQKLQRTALIISVGFWRWCVGIERIVLLGFIHRLVSQKIVE